MLSPTTWPVGLTALAKLKVPPSTPRSTAVTVELRLALASPVEAPAPPIRRAATTTAPKIRNKVTSSSSCLGVP